MAKKGIFITFEGTEGAGKSTLIQALARILESHGMPVTTTREPGGSAVAEKIRDLILHHPMNAWTELFLYEAARAEHLHQTILPALAKGSTVLCDRFADSSLAYQSYARGLDWKTVKTLNGIATQKLKPNLTILLDIDPARGLKSASNPNRFEAEGVDFQVSVRKGFLKAMREEPKRWMKIPARSGTPEEMAATIFRELSRRFGWKKKK